MKKTLLFGAALLLSLGTFAQTTIWSENFEATTGVAIPATFTQTTAATDGGWKSGTALSSTDFPIPAHTRYVASNDDACNCDKLSDILISPSINLSTYTSNVYLTFEYVFAGGTYQSVTEKAEILYSTNGGTTWTLLDTMAATFDLDWHSKTVALTSIQGQANAKIAIKYSDGGGYLFGMAVDDMKIHIPAAYDLSAIAINTPKFNAIGNVPITGVITNLGTTTITSFTLNYTINGGAPVTTNVTGVNIPIFGTYTFTHPTNYNAIALGNYTVEAYATSLNGSNTDAVAANDKVTKVITILSESVQRVPLLEVFTSSTCPPCNPGNANLHSIIDTKPKSEYVVVKFQQDFPGTGDPYCTTEAVNRRAYYSINSIPRMEIDGAWDGNANSYTEALYTSSKAVIAQYKMDGTCDVSGNNITAKVRWSPLFNATGAKLYVAVLESKDTANIKNNGETEFFQVMKKMLPNENGTSLPNTAVGNWDSLSFNYQFKGNYRLPADGATANRVNHTTEHCVEKFPFLYTIAWIQAADKTVYQAANLTLAKPLGTETFSKSITGINVYPMPSTNVVNVEIKASTSEKMMATIIDMQGNVVEAKQLKSIIGLNTISFNVSQIANGIYNLILFDEKGNSSVREILVQH